MCRKIANENNKMKKNKKNGQNVGYLLPYEVVFNIYAFK